MAFRSMGLDIMGPFPTAVRQLKFLLAGIDYFTKWVEVEALAAITEKNLEGAKGIWPEELPSILWAYRTTTRTPTGKTPFRLTYGSEAVILVEVGLTSYRVVNYDEEKNDEAIRLQLDMVDVVRATAEQRLALYQNLMARHYNSRVKHRDF
ncbi:uncharacterized protein LOC142624858 [Castanea sativa]|uniref:uncharacterized protein LOC142624858 n=1 Tax=Castanea sativa TaxID=21020 RepID=UPI003F64A0F4